MNPLFQNTSIDWCNTRSTSNSLGLLIHLLYQLLTTKSTTLSLVKLILPAFQHIPIKDIKPLHIVDFLGKLEKENSRGDKKSGGLSSGTIEIDHRSQKLKNPFGK
ncbi:tyrosine-type recombinase/integrase [Paenibacillus selenitireducens]|uniref:hypothetical protein n=1 Tax=Paenibacillus selenitireducens TaxID=1324314 RepID=UPI00117D4028